MDCSQVYGICREIYILNICLQLYFRKNGKTVHVIDPAYKESVEAKVVEVFGERSLKNVYSMIEDVLEDEKMVC